jgi:hypothetical protein
VIAMMCFKGFSWVMDLTDSTTTTTSRAAIFAARIRDRERPEPASIAWRTDEARPLVVTRLQACVAPPTAPVVDA